MAWTLLEDITTNVFIQSVCTDEISKIFYGKTTGCFQYDIDTDTVTQIDNGSSLNGVGGTFDHLRYFNSGLYVASVATHDYPDVFKYSSGTTWNEVFTPTGLSYSSFLYGAWDFLVGQNVMILVMSGGNSSSDYEMLAFNTTNGASWQSGDVQEGDVSPPLVLGVPSAIPYVYNVNFSNQILDDLYGMYLMQSGVPDDNNLYKIMKWSDANVRFETVAWRKKESGVQTGDNWVKDYISQDNAHWADGVTTSSEYHYDTDPLDGSFIAPASQDFVLPALATGTTIPSQGFPTSYLNVGYKKTSLGGGNNQVDMVLINSDGSLESAEEITSSGDRTPRCFIRMPENGNVYAILQNGSNYEIWDRGTPLNPPPIGEGNYRLWMYKTQDGGISWTNRGIKTA